MELFSEIYNCYYQVLARILEEASRRPVTPAEMNRIAETYGYGESALAIIPHLLNGDWALLTSDDDGQSYTSRLLQPLTNPLTALQKAWLKTLLEDERIGLFFTDRQLTELNRLLAGTLPLYDPASFEYFDQYRDKDVITATFREHFRIILRAIQKRRKLNISYYSVKGRLMEYSYLPCRIEYSAKDGKFRLYALFQRQSGWRMDILHIGRILKIEKTDYYIKKPVDLDRYMAEALCKEPIVMEISDERNALERIMLHFACYQKKVEKIDETGKYRCSVYYEKNRETELLIQVLAFGPMVRILSPASFLDQIKERLRMQKRLTST